MNGHGTGTAGGTSPVDIHALQPSDWPAVRAIYLEGIATRNATFATDAPEWEAWDRGHLAACRLVAHADETMLGWVALSPVSARCVYAGVCEVSIYIAEKARGRGIGKLLISELITQSERAGIWTLQAGIFPENKASIALFKNSGFRIVGTRERLGAMDGRWRDVSLLERRSASAGV